MTAPLKGVRVVTGEISRSKIVFARLVVALMVAFALGGIVWYGLAPATLARVWHNLVDRPDGPMVFRFFLQPAMATIAAVLSGIRDAKLARAPFLETILTRPAERAGRLDEAMVDTSRVMLLGLIMDGIYQYIEFDTFHPAEAVIITLLLAILPYVVMRGPVARVARRWFGVGATKAGR